jgi:predicted ATPase
LRGAGAANMDHIPEGLRDVLGKHLSRLCDEANHVLRVAAVIGREFRVDLLAEALAAPQDEVISALLELVVSDRTLELTAYQTLRKGPVI